MAVNTEVLSHSYKPGAAMLPEAIGFPFILSTDIVVTHIAAATSVRTVLAPDKYILAGDFGAGTATIRAIAAWPVADDWLVTRSTALLQEAKILAGVPLPSADVEQTLDRVTLAAQERRAEVAALGDRAITVPVGELAPVLVPAPLRTGGNKVLAPNPVTGAIEVRDVGSNFKGDPGGNAMAIGLFVAAGTLLIPVGTDLVQTSGWDIRGRGDARYAYDETINAAYVAANPRTSFMSNNGRGFGLAEALVTAEMLGAEGDGVTDDTVALQAAFSFGRSIQLTQGKTFLLKSKLILSASGVSVMGGGKIKIGAWDFASDTDGNGTHFRAIFVTGANNAISNIVFDATGVVPGTGVENGFIWCTAPGLTVSACDFIGNPKGTSIWGLGGSPYLTVTGCQFTNCSGAVFARERSASITNNTIINATDAAIALNGTTCIGAVVSNNVISNEALNLIPSMIAVEESASNWAIIGNTLQGVNGGGIIATNVLLVTSVEGGTIIGNVIDARNFAGTLPNSGSPSALISILPSYRNCIVANNKVGPAPPGNSNTRLIIVPATGGILHDNIVDGSGTAGLSALIGITAEAGGLTIKDNKTTAAAGARHFLFGTGSYSGNVVNFVGGDMIGGSEGINTALNNPPNLLVWMKDIARITAASPVNMGANMNWGSRQSFFNAAGAVAWPHRINGRTVMFGNAVPTAGAWLAGDTIYNTAPSAGTPAPGWVCSVGGTPGTWRTMAATV